MESTLVIIKPNGVQRELVGQLISRFERRGLKITALKMVTVDRETATLHYREHREKDFFDDLVSFISSAPSVIMVLEGERAVSLVRRMVGDTDPAEAEPGTIRGDYATTVGHNMIHASDSPESARREVEIFFEPRELQNYTLSVRPWL